jgi:protein-tyrosine phosphatase
MNQKQRRVILAIAFPVIVLAAGFSVYAHLCLGGFQPTTGIQTAVPSGPNYTKVEEGLYLGGRVPEPPPGTQAVLNLCEFKDEFHAEVQQWSPILNFETPSLGWLKDQVDFIGQQRRAGLTTFVHCFGGIDRSAMVVTAYEMHRRGWTRDQALDFVRSQRPDVQPNDSYMRLLLEWEKDVQKRQQSWFSRRLFELIHQRPQKRLRISDDADGLRAAAIG